MKKFILLLFFILSSFFNQVYGLSFNSNTSVYLSTNKLMKSVADMMLEVCSNTKYVSSNNIVFAIDGYLNCDNSYLSLGETIHANLYTGYESNNYSILIGYLPNAGSAYHGLSENIYLSNPFYNKYNKAQLYKDNKLLQKNNTYLNNNSGISLLYSVNLYDDILQLNTSYTYHTLEHNINTQEDNFTKIAKNYDIVHYHSPFDVSLQLYTEYKMLGYGFLISARKYTDKKLTKQNIFSPDEMSYNIFADYLGFHLQAGLFINHNSKIQYNNKNISLYYKIWKVTTGISYDYAFTKYSTQINQNHSLHSINYLIDFQINKQFFANIVYVFQYGFNDDLKPLKKANSHTHNILLGIKVKI